MECRVTSTAFDSPSILSILLDEDKDANEIKVAPSRFIKEMAMSTEERTEKLKKLTRKVKVLSEENLKTFKVTPDIVIFQNFVVGKTYSVCVSLLNLQEISVPVQVVSDTSQYFAIYHCSETVCTKIAPGMSYQFKVNFTPEELSDYKHEVTFITESETFTLTLLAIGPRPLLSIPDQITIPETVVKTTSEKKIWFQNTSETCARFTVLTKHPFEVDPKKTTLAPKEIMAFNLYFKPFRCGNYQDEMIIRFESGECLCVKLEAKAIEASVYLEQTRLTFRDTYEGLSDQRSVKLYNNSDFIVQYYWKLHPSIDVEKQHADYLKNKWKEVKEYESLRGNKLEVFEVIDFEGHTKVYDRIYCDEVDEFESNDQFLYQHKAFQIEPISGEVYPHSNTSFMLFFNPDACKQYQSFAYLEVIGKEERLQLNLVGNGLAPVVTLNVEFLNVNEIFVNLVHRYEIVAFNKGPIPAKVRFFQHFKKNPYREIDCVPLEQNLKPHECKAFVLEFSSIREGSFVEEIKFSVSDSPDLLSVTMAGHVVCPLLYFDVAEVDFGRVALGYSITKDIHLINPSTVAVFYEVDIPRDGTRPAIRCEEFTTYRGERYAFGNVKELEFYPKVGVAEPKQTVSLAITLTPNIIRSHEAQLVVRMWKNYKITIQLKYKADVPSLEIIPSEILIRFSFVSYPYNRTICLRNKTDLSGYFYVVGAGLNTSQSIVFTTKISEGFIYPYENLEIPLTITVRALGEQELNFYVTIFGSKESYPCLIRCNGQGPVLNINPEIMDFGKVQMLKEHRSFLTLMNESPIPARVTAFTSSSNSVFQIDSTALALEPLARGKMEASIYLCNPGRHTDSLIFHIDNAVDITVKLIAYGVGTSVATEPALEEELYLGLLLTRHKFCYPIKFTNKGFRSHRIRWSNKKSGKIPKPAELLLEKEPVFVFQPDAYDLSLNDSIVVNLEAYYHEKGLQEENFYCHAAIQGQKEKQMIISTHVSAVFVDPSVELSKKVLSFRIDIGPNNFLDSSLKDFITIENITGVAVSFNAELKPPFYIVYKEQLKNCVPYFLGIDEKIDLFVQFEPDLTGKKECRTVHGTLKLLYHEHPKQENVRLIGEINYPNVAIDSFEVQMNCVTNFASDYQEIVLKNVSTLPVKYHWEWDEECFSEETLGSTSANILQKYDDSIAYTTESSDSDSALEEPIFIQTIATYQEKGVQSEKAYGYKQTRVIQVYDRAYVEEYNYKEYLQIQYYISSVECLAISDTPESEKRFEAMRVLLLPIISNPPGVIKYKSVHTIRNLPTMQKLKHHIDSVLDIAPYEGVLPPHECQLISISFHPKPDTAIKASAVCSVLGGLNRSISIHGVASDMGYQLDTNYIDFGRQLFCETCERKIQLKNTGNCILEYGTTCLHLPEGQACELSMEERWLCIQPKQGAVEPGRTIDVTIKYFPRINEEFSILFLMEIGYFPPTKVIVHGYAAFNQIYVALPRPTINSCNYFWQYTSVANLTPDYLRAVNSCKNLHVHSTYHDRIPKAVRKELERDGWIVVLYSDLFPTIMDLELALERALAYEYLFANPAKVKMHSSNRKFLSIPGLFVPAYVVDFESVILGNCVDYVASICNYGPSAAYIRLLEKGKKDNKSPDKGFEFQLTKKHLQVGDTAELLISFCPTFQTYPEVPIAVDEEVLLEVQHGPKVPIYVKAFVCTPRISYDQSVVDFGEVKCCNCLRKSLLLTNDGPVGTLFTATLLPKNPKKPKYTGPFSLATNSDFVQKDKQYLLDVYFQPTVDGNVDAKLILQVEQNPYELIVCLKGVGLCPSLRIEERVVNFGAILPYQIECEQQFLIENTSPFPIEVYFPDFDYDVEREETILKLLGDYYQQQKFYVPPRVAGGGLPRSFIDFYHHILEQVGQKLVDEEMERQLTLGRSSMDTSKHTGSSKSLGSRSTSTRAAVSAVDIERTKNALFDKTRDEFEELLKKQLQCIMDGSAPPPPFDPLQAAFEDVAKQSSEKKPDDQLDCVFLIFHGPSQTRFPYVSNTISKQLQLPVYSIDRLFFEGLLASDSAAALEINVAINEKFMKIASECDLLSTPDEDAMDNLQKKVNLILSGKEKKAPTKAATSSARSSASKRSSDKTSSTKGSKSARKEKVRKQPEVFMDLPLDLIIEILKEKFKEFRIGAIIESLYSSILRNPSTAMSVLLTSLGNARYIHFVLFSFTYNDYCVYKEHLKQLEATKKIEESKKLLQRIKQMEADEYEELPVELRELYRENVLKERKLASIAKREALKKRLLEGEKKLETPAKVDVGTVVSEKLGSGKKSKLDRSSPIKSDTSKNGGKGSKGKSGKKAEKKSKSSKGGSKTSEGSKKSKKGGRVKEKLSPEEEIMRSSLLACEDLTRTILHTMEYWDRRTCMLSKPFPTGQAAKLNKKAPKAAPKKGDKKSPLAKNSALAEDSSQSQLSPENDPEIGIPLWIIRNANPEKEVEQTISYHLENEPELLESYTNIKDSLKEVIVESSELFSILTVPSRRKEKNISKIFTIADVVENPPPTEAAITVEELQAITKIDESPSKDLSTKTNIQSRSKKQKRSKKQQLGVIRSSQDRTSIASSVVEKSAEIETINSKESFAPRRILQPGDQWQYRVLFQSQLCGDYKHTFTLEIANAKAVYSIECLGKCDIPKLNTSPEVIYPKIIPARTEKNAHKSCVYVKKSGIFDFGYIFLQKLDENAFEPLGTELHLRNQSSLPCTITVSLKDSQSKTFVYQPEDVVVEPEAEESLKLFALPDKRAKFENQLLLSIENNPKVEAIRLSCTGCHVNFMIRPKLINFDHALINQTSRQEIVLENISDVSVFWRIVEAEKITKVFKFSCVKGSMAPSSRQQLFIEYTPFDSTGIHKMQIMIHAYQLFYDDVKSKTPIYKDFLTISTEVVSVDITYAREIPLGSIKANVPITKSYSFINNGQHDVQFAFSDIKSSNDPNYKSNEYIRKMFTMDPMEGVLLPETEFKATINFLCKKPISFTKVPILRCTFSYPEYSLVIDSFTVTASAKVHVPKYEIYPSDEVHFGHQLISTEKCQEMLVKNTGSFDFSFVMKSLKEILAQKMKNEKKKVKGLKKATIESKSDTKVSGKSGSKASDAKSSKKSENKSKTSIVSSKVSKESKATLNKNKKKKGGSAREVFRPTTLNVGPFKIISSTGKVDPGKIQRIKIYSIPNDVKEYNETVMFILKDGSAQHKRGKPIYLTCAGSVPNISLEDLQYIFQEVYIVETYDGTNEIKQMGPHCIFIVDEKSLFFGNVILNTVYRINLHIRNTGQITTELISHINDEQNVFSLTPDIITVEPFTSVTISLAFKPTSIEVFEASLHITYSCPESHLAKVLECKLFGKGHMPEIQILEPLIEDSKAPEIIFNATLMGTCSCKDVVFKNIGQIDCTVLLEISGDVHDVFALLPKNDTIKMLKIWNTDVSSAMKHTNSVDLKPDDVASFELHFVPKFDTLFNCTLKLHIVNNPYESASFSVVAQSFDGDVIIEGLPAKIIPTFSSNASLTTPAVAYELDFKHCPVNLLKRKCFKIINHSKQFTYRFQFAIVNSITFIPAIGHLKPQFYKEIVCTFLTETPQNVNEQRIELLLCKVTYSDPQKWLLSWDERQNLIVWETNKEGQTENEIVKPKSEADNLQTNLENWSDEHNVVKFKNRHCSGEPEYYAEPDSNVVLHILFNVIADYCSYTCTVDKIHFDDTFAMQENSQTFEVVNTSQVNLMVEWNMWMDERFPRRINSPIFGDKSRSDVSGFEIIAMKRIRSLRNVPQLPPRDEDNTANNDGSAASLFSASGNNSNRSNDTWCEQDTIPFEITPETITIPPQQTQQFCVKFKPQDVFQYLVHLDGKIANLKPDTTNISILVGGRSILPLYHFDLEKVDINKIREGRRLCKEITDENTQVVMFEAIGLSQMAVRKFKIINPTADNLSYKWIPLQINSNSTFCFNCVQPSGVIPRGNTTEAAFTFSPRSYGIFEAFYSFDVPQHQLTTRFLLYGVARKPKVYFEHPHMNLKPTVLGIEVIDEIHLKNDDNVLCKFKILKDSLASPSKDHVLIVEPLIGELQPCSSQVIRVIFRPKKMGTVTFHIKCVVQNMENPIFLGVTGQCLKVKPVVSYENFEGQQIILKSKFVNDVRLKPMVPYQKEQLIFTIANAGKTGFYFIWFVNTQLYSDRVKFNFKDQEGYVTAETDTRSIISITPLKNILLRNVKMKLQIPYGPTYVLRLSGSASNSQFLFSFDSYDFGQCLVQKAETQNYSTILKFKNTDVIPIILEYNVRKMNCITVNFKSKIVRPRKSEEIPIYFHPMEVTDYHNLIPFFVNSKIYTVSIHGEGVPLHLDLVVPADRFIDLGSTIAGKPVTRAVKVINNSAVAVDAKFDIWDRLPFFIKKIKTLEPEFDLPEKLPIIYDETKQKAEGKAKKKGAGKSKELVEKKEKKPKKEAKAKGGKKGKKSDTASSKSNKKGKKEKGEKKVQQTDEQIQAAIIERETAEEKERRLIAESISMFPKTYVKIHPKHIFEFQIKFNPSEAMKSFTEKIGFQVQDTVETVCMVKAACLGMNYYLDRNYVDFGSTVYGRKAVQKIILYNTGDIGARYKWALEKSNSVFKITPTEGISIAHSEIIFSVSFYAAELYQFFKTQARCIIENYDKPLSLELTGCCVHPPSPKETLKFECPVRDVHTNEVEIVNTSYSEWSIRPAVTGQYFSIPAVVTIKPNSSSLLQVTYHPLSMSRGVPHEGSLSLYLPDQSILSYKLIGIAKQPQPVDRLYREIACKTYYTENLPVQNWLNSPQEFCVATQAEKTDPKNKILYKLAGNSVIDVSANSVREYKWTIYVLKEGTLNLKVIFHNVKTKEYLFYEMSFEVKKCPSLETIELSTCVRKPVTYRLVLENPIKTPVNYTISADSTLLNFEKNVHVPSLREQELLVTFNPLNEGAAEVILEATSDDLGAYVYTFKLNALAPVPEPPIYFTATLGEIISQKLPLKNDRAEKVELLTRFDHDAFYSVRGAVLAPGEVRNLDINFEPAELGKLQGTLMLVSSQMGQYIYPLIGTSSYPKPQGPFPVKPGTYRKMNFKNPFKETKTFSVIMRPESFFTTTPTIEVESKRQARILVGLESVNADETACAVTYPRTGKMIVKCNDAAAVKWTYYLEEECTTAAPSSSEKSSRVSVSTSKSKSTKSPKSSTSTKSSKSPKSSSQS